MRKLFNILSLILVFGSLFFSCSKKYPEDGIYYMGKSPEKRLIGAWRLTKYYINRANATNFLFDQYIGWGQYGFGNNAGPLKYQYGIIDFNIGAADPNGKHQMSSQSIDGGGEVFFQNSEDNLKIYFGMEYGDVNNNPTFYNPFRENPNNIPAIPFWKVNELTNITFKISNTINDTTYNIEFAKQ